MACPVRLDQLAIFAALLPCVLGWRRTRLLWAGVPLPLPRLYALQRVLACYQERQISGLGRAHCAHAPWPGAAAILWGTKTRSPNGHGLSVRSADRGCGPSAWEASGLGPRCARSCGEPAVDLAVSPQIAVVNIHLCRVKLRALEATAEAAANDAGCVRPGALFRKNGRKRAC